MKNKVIVIVRKNGCFIIVNPFPALVAVNGTTKFRSTARAPYAPAGRSRATLVPAWVGPTAAWPAAAAPRRWAGRPTAGSGSRSSSCPGPAPRAVSGGDRGRGVSRRVANVRPVCRGSGQRLGAGSWHFFFSYFSRLKKLKHMKV